ncbi:MAG TPA: hypothetical protein PLS00_16645 [Niabella sp.]|nr:hypothetical protein [Niabella sp.]HUN04480.1 hypothetical protein [Niabella sp.]
MRKNVGYIIIPALMFFMISCGAVTGEYPLGNHLVLWDNDKEGTAIIIYCDEPCHGGIQVLPTRERQWHSGEYVESAKSNSKWVIVKTYQKIAKQENYWIISKDFNLENVDCSQVNCDSILQSHVKGPMTQTGFRDTVHLLNIGLDFK